MPILIYGMRCRRFYGFVLYYSSMTRMRSSKSMRRPVSSSSLATIDPCLTTFLACPVRTWLKECRGILPRLTDFNDLLVERARGAAELADRGAYLVFRCCSIFVLTSLAQMYDIIARCSISPQGGHNEFRKLCDKTLKDIATITVDFTKDDYSFLEPALTVSPPTTHNRRSTERSLDELDTCLEPCRCRRRPGVVSDVC